MLIIKERNWESILQKRKGQVFHQETLISQIISLPQTCAIQATACDKQKHLFSLHYRKSIYLKVWRFLIHPLLWNPVMNFGALMATETLPVSEREVSWMSPLLNDVTIRF